MYTLTEKQQAKVEEFIESLPDSMQKGTYQRWYEEVKKTGRITVDQLHGFLSLATNLPAEFQSEPQNIVLLIKNGLDGDEEKVVVEPAKKKDVKAKK